MVTATATCTAFLQQEEPGRQFPDLEAFDQHDLSLFELDNTTTAATITTDGLCDASLITYDETAMMRDLVNGNQQYHGQNEGWEEAFATDIHPSTTSLPPSTGNSSPSSALEAHGLVNSTASDSIKKSLALGDKDMFPSLDITRRTASIRSTATPRSTSDTTANRGSPYSSGDSPEGSHRIKKRQRNTEAARRYRQRKVDKLTELEEALQEMAKERDELRLKLARAEAEADVLRGMVRK